MESDEKRKRTAAFYCPTPIDRFPAVQLAHGGGGRLMHQLIEELFLPEFRNPLLEMRHDGALLDLDDRRVAFTTDSYIVSPIFFPGGDIGSLSIYGTVNDLAACGARPLYLSAGFILEEGFPMDQLRRVVGSMKHAAARVRVQLVTGDTKVVDRGKGDGIFINTAGIGIRLGEQPISPARIEEGDRIIVSGDIGRHAVAVMAVREGLEFESTIESDCAPITDMVTALLEADIGVHCLRDLTRGGLGSGLIEIAEAGVWRIEIEETAIPVDDNVRGACEMLGFDPLYLANEGRCVLFVRSGHEEPALEIIRSHPEGKQANVIGRVSKGRTGLVTMKTRIGTHRIIEMLSGEQLPRIC
jgi:hydrogenase expression/formation protein HypE